MFVCVILRLIYLCQAWLDIIQRQREDDEKQRLKEEAERKRKREELKWRKDLLEGAFDGELEEIKKILKQVLLILSK